MENSVGRIETTIPIYKYEKRMITEKAEELGTTVEMIIERLVEDFLDEVEL